MEDFDFGEELAAARRRNGLSVQDVSTALRIRADVVRAIEASDFDHMPAKGFARNQVSAYARYLGLDSAEITNRFLSEYSSFERGAGMHSYRMDQQAPSTNSSMSYARSRKYQRMSEEMKARPGYRTNHRLTQSQNDSFERAFERQEYGEPGEGRAQGSRGRYGDRGSGRPPRRKQQSSRGSRGSGGGRGPRGGYGERRVSGTSNRGGGLIASILSSRIALIVIAVIIVLIVVLAVTRCSGGATSGATSGATTTTASSNAVPVTGGSSSSSTMQDSSDDALTSMPEDVSATATSFALRLTVADGQSSWVQVDVDGSTPIAEVVSGPQTLEYTVAESASIQVGNSTAVSVTAAGQAVELNSSDDGLGTLTLTLTDGQVVTS